MTRFLLAALLLLPPTTRPTAQLVVTCAAGSRQCVLDGSGSTNAVHFAFDFGTGQPPETRAKVTNTFPAGSWCVRLVVFDSAGASSYATKQVVVPYVAGTKFGACSTKPAPIRVDTVTIKLPPDTIRIVRTDTLRDTVALAVTINSPFPNIAGIYVDSLWASQGMRVFRISLLGQLHTVGGKLTGYCNPNGWPAPQPNNSLSLGVFPSFGTFPTMGAATAALDTLTTKACNK